MNRLKKPLVQVFSYQFHQKIKTLMMLKTSVFLEKAGGKNIEKIND